MGCGEKETMSIICVMSSGSAFTEYDREITPKEKIGLDLLYNTVIPLLDIYSPKTKPLISKAICMFMFSTILSKIVKI